MDRTVQHNDTPASTPPPLMVVSSCISAAEGWHVVRISGHTSAKSVFRLDKSFPQGAPNPLSHISCMDFKAYSRARGDGRGLRYSLSQRYFGDVSLGSTRLKSWHGINPQINTPRFLHSDLLEPSGTLHKTQNPHMPSSF